MQKIPFCFGLWLRHPSHRVQWFVSGKEVGRKCTYKDHSSWFLKYLPFNNFFNGFNLPTWIYSKHLDFNFKERLCITCTIISFGLYNTCFLYSRLSVKTKPANNQNKNRNHIGIFQCGFSSKERKVASQRGWERFKKTKSNRVQWHTCIKCHNESHLYANLTN